MLDGTINGLPNLMGFEVKLDLMSIKLRHFSGLAHEPIQAVAFFINNLQQVFSLRLVQPNIGQQCLCRCFDRS